MSSPPKEEVCAAFRPHYLLKMQNQTHDYRALANMRRVNSNGEIGEMDVFDFEHRDIYTDRRSEEGREIKKIERKSINHSLVLSIL